MKKVGVKKVKVQKFKGHFPDLIHTNRKSLQSPSDHDVYGLFLIYKLIKQFSVRFPTANMLNVAIVIGIIFFFFIKGEKETTVQNLLRLLTKNLGYHHSSGYLTQLDKGSSFFNPSPTRDVR